MPPEVYMSMLPYVPTRGSYDLHHALVDKGDVKGMPLKEREKIHNKYNLWWVASSDHASHANIPDKKVFYKLLCERWGKGAVDSFIRSFRWKSRPPVTVEWLES